MESGSTLQRGQSVISEEGLKKMGKDLIYLCDGLERHGLVDYEYGVWEELIEQSRPNHRARTNLEPEWLMVGCFFANMMAIVLEECLNQYETANNAGNNSTNAADSSRYASR